MQVGAHGHRNSMMVKKPVPARDDSRAIVARWGGQLPTHLNYVYSCLQARTAHTHTDLEFVCAIGHFGS